MTKITLSKALKDNDLESFIKEHEQDSQGDLDKIDAIIRCQDQDKLKASQATSQQESDDD
jgi:hypothetical protein